MPMRSLDLGPEEKALILGLNMACLLRLPTN